jgi:hypothetical protein
LESIATRVDADIPDEAVGGGVANEEFVGARVAKRIRRARTERATRAATRGRSACTTSAPGANHAADTCCSSSSNHAAHAAAGAVASSGASTPRGSRSLKDRGTSITATHEERERHHGKRPQPAAGDILSYFGFGLFHFDQGWNPAWQLGGPPSRGDAQTCRTGQSVTFEQLPPLGTHSLCPSGQSPTQSKPEAQSVGRRHSPYCPHAVVLPAPAVSQTGADPSVHSEFTHASGGV